MTIYFLKDIMCRRKAHVTNDQVKTVYVPQYKNLSVDKILEYATNHPVIDMYLPE